MTHTRLIVHIGQGKTGSTSIQHALNSNLDALKSQGIHYLGHMLENGGTKQKQSWQHPGGVWQLLHQMPDETVTDQVAKVLGETLDHLSETGTKVAVWSNEALFQRRLGVAPALVKLRAAGRPISVVAYLRRHDSWAQSAYAQWGIKHKTNTGPVRSFRDWIIDNPVRFAEPLDYWNQQLGQDFQIVNFDKTDNVTEDFLSRIGATGIAAHRVYETPSTDVLSAWAVHNSRFPTETLPGSFMRILNASGVLNEPAPDVADPKDLLPSADDLADVLTDASEDFDRVNALLAKKGQPQFDKAAPAKPKAAPTDWEMTKLLMTMVSSQQEQIIRLRKRVEVLEK